MDVSRPHLDKELAASLADLRIRLESMNSEDRQRAEERLKNLAERLVRGEQVSSGDICGNGRHA